MSVVHVVKFRRMGRKRVQALAELFVTLAELFGHRYLSPSIPDVLPITDLTAAALKVISATAEFVRLLP